MRPAVKAAAPLRILHVGSEVFPLIKTGGLADVMGALPMAQAERGADVRLLLPGFPAVLDGLPRLREVANIGPQMGAWQVRLLASRKGLDGLTVYVIDAPLLYRRPGGPYHQADGRDWPDNVERFALLSMVAARLGMGDADPQWQPQVVHAHDWHAALACAYLKAHPVRSSASVFTIHNLAYQGRFPMAERVKLGLPDACFTPAGLEFHGDLSFMKAGLVYADRITTVSPRYAWEIATPAFGCGLDGVIRARGQEVSGILNGMDIDLWNPSRDTALAASYSAHDLHGKAACKAALQQAFHLEPNPDAPLLAMVNRLTPQKGVDLVLSNLGLLLAEGAQVVIQGNGEAWLEHALRTAVQTWPGRVAAHLGYDESLAHRIMAGADLLLMPSRFEPCGLTQMYAMRYGTLPVVHAVGGLADTVADGHTGFHFLHADPGSMLQAVHRALAVWRDAERRQAMIVQAMQVDHSWSLPAAAYLDLYRSLVQAAR